MTTQKEYVSGNYEAGSPKAIIKNFMNMLLGYTDTKIYNEGGINGFFTDDIELHLPGTRPDTPWAGTFRGLNEMNEFWAICDKHLDIISHDVQHIIGDGDKVIVVAHEKMASKITGTKGEQMYAWLFQLRDGKIWYWRLFEATEAIANTFRVPAGK